MQGITITTFIIFIRIANIYSDLIKQEMEVVKQDMERVNIDIPGISKIKWSGMGEFTQMTIMSTTVGKSPWGEME